jgi:hypothetical protein
MTDTDGIVYTLDEAKDHIRQAFAAWKGEFSVSAADDKGFDAHCDAVLAAIDGAITQPSWQKRYWEEGYEAGRQVVPLPRCAICGSAIHDRPGDPATHVGCCIGDDDNCRAAYLRVFPLDIA